MDSEILLNQLTEELAEKVLTTVLGKSISSKNNFTNFPCKLGKFKREHNLGIDLNRKRFNCFKCQVSGGLFDLVMKVESLTFQQSITRIASLAGIVDKRKSKFFNFTEEEFAEAEAYVVANPQPEKLPEVDPEDVELESFFEALRNYKV
jgi:hypothetical protein